VTRKYALVLVLLIASLPLSAQTATTCGNDETIEVCFGRLAQATDDVKLTTAAAAQAVAMANTGVPAITSPAGSALKDFLTLFTASIDAASLSEGQDGALTLDWNLGAAQFATGRPFKLQAVFYKPALNPKVKAALTGDLLQQTEGGLDDLDDMAASLTYSPQTRRNGRTLSPHRELISLLTRTASRAEGRATTAQKFLQVLQTVQTQPPFNGGADTDTVTFGQLTDDQRMKIEPLVVASARELLQITQRYQDALNAAGFQEFKKLLHAQPQAYGSVVQRTRNDLVGPDELSLKLTYETSGRALGAFYKDAKDTCDSRKLQAAARNAGGQEARDCMTAWREFLADEKTRATISSPGRFAFSLEYAGVAAQDVRFPALTPPFELKTDDSETLTASLTYGRVLTGDPLTPGSREGRLDLTARYENATGDADRDNRYVVSAIYSQKITDTLILPIGFIYANHDKDLVEVDHQVSMHFGLVYKLPSLGGLLGQQ
jgi:hypothetical protein